MFELKVFAWKLNRYWKPPGGRPPDVKRLNCVVEYEIRRSENGYGHLYFHFVGDRGDLLWSKSNTKALRAQAAEIAAREGAYFVPDNWASHNQRVLPCWKHFSSDMIKELLKIMTQGEILAFVERKMGI